MKDEFFPLVDEKGNVIGKATRRECHSGSMLLHPVVHLHVISTAGEIYLQKRSMSKDIQPGKWDTAVGGHVDFGETVSEALFRECREELGLENFSPVKLVSYVFQSSREKELVNTYYIIVEPEKFSPVFDRTEIDDARFWSVRDIEKFSGENVFTPNFESEFKMIKNLFRDKQ